MLMKKEDFSQLFDDVKNGVIEKKEALGKLGDFIQKNYQQTKPWNRRSYSG